MGTVMYPCGCIVSSSMFGEREIMGVIVCLKHSIDDEIHAARKCLYEIAGSEYPANFQDQDVQAALCALADLIRAEQEEL